MSDKDSNEVPVNITSDYEANNDLQNMEFKEESGSPQQTETEEEPELSKKELKEQLEQEKEKTTEYELKLKRILADYQNLQRKIHSEIDNTVNTKIDQLMIDFLQIYDDFVRAKGALSKNNVNTEGLDAILKNMDSLLSRYNIKPIDALGEIFNPKLHEAISIVEDTSLEDNTITKELRKGYISQNRVIRPTLVEISKRPVSQERGE